MMGLGQRQWAYDGPRSELWAYDGPMSDVSRLTSKKVSGRPRIVDISWAILCCSVGLIGHNYSGSMMGLNWCIVHPGPF